MKKFASIINNDYSDDIGKLVLRIILGFTMLLHGLDKLLNGVEGLAGMLDGKGLPGFIVYGVYLGEVIAPALILIGYKSRLAALIYSFNMLFAILMVHSGDFFTLTSHGGWGVELQMLYLVGGLTVVFLGSGKFSLSKGHGDWD